MKEERKFEEVIKPEDRLNEELLEDIIGGISVTCSTGKVVIQD